MNIHCFFEASRDLRTLRVSVCVYTIKSRDKDIHARVALPDAGSERANGRGGANALRLLQPEVQ